MEKDNCINIQGDKVCLRSITYDDTRLIVSWRNNENVKKNFIFREKFTEEMHNKWMRDKVDTGLVIQFIIIDNEFGNPIGSVFLKDIDEKNLNAEFGIFIGDDSMRGKGYGTEATKLILGYGFNVLKLHRIFLRVLATNKVASRVYENVGFCYEGRFREAIKETDVYDDIVFMSILKSEYDNTKN